MKQVPLAFCKQKEVEMGIGDVLGGLAGKIPGLSWASRGAGAAGGAVSGAGRAAGWAAVSSAQESIKDPGFWLFFIGLGFSWLAMPFIQGSKLLILITNIILAAYATFFIFKGRGWLVLMLFVLWVLVFKSSLSLNVLIPMGLIVASYLLWIKWTGKGVGHEMVGWVVILFFYLEFGLIELIMGKFNLTITNLFQNVILYFPWWAVLGLYATKKETFIISALKVGCFFVIAATVVMAFVPSLGYEGFETSVPGLGEIAGERLDVRGEAKGENPFISTVYCLASDITHMTECVDKRQLASKCKHKKKEGVPDAENEEYQACLQEVKEGVPALVATGGFDPTAEEYTKIEFSKPEGFSEEIYKKRFPLPFQMKVESPRRELDISISCFFKKGEDIIPGIASPVTFKVKGKPPAKNIICTPAMDLSSGSWKVELSAEIANLETTSKVRRLFIGEKTEDDKKKYKKEFPLPGGTFGPISAKEFARVNFWFGQPPTNPLIGFDDEPLFIANIENLGQGEITEIKNIEISLMEGLTPTGECEMTYGENKMTKTDVSVTGLGSRKTLPIEACFLTVSQELRDPERYFKEKFINRVFLGKLQYNYRIKKEFGVKVILIGSTSIPTS